MQQQYPPQQPQYYPPSFRGLGIGDGFKFGCGFFIAGAIALLAIYVVTFLLLVLMGGLVGGIFEQITRELSFILPALI